MVLSGRNGPLAYLYHTIEVWGIGGDNVGLIKSTKAPKLRPRVPLRVTHTTQKSREQIVLSALAGLSRTAPLYHLEHSASAELIKESRAFERSAISLQPAPYPKTQNLKPET